MINRAKVSLFWGFIILIFHICLSAYLWLVFSPAFDSSIAIAEISTPLTVTYAVTIVKYFIDNQASVAGGQMVSIAYFAFTAIIIVPFLFGLAFLPYHYSQGELSIDALNRSYVFLEASIGALFILVFNDLFKSSGTTKPYPSPHTKKR
ncbi:MAG: hypothetical protein AAGF71_09135 [Pseudomonadota bacterium]